MPFVLRSGLSLHYGGRVSVSEYRMTLRAAKVPLESEASDLYVLLRLYLY